MICKHNNIRIVVLDDDPTGIQTVHGCLLVTEWNKEQIREAFRHEQPFFYILTNTRAKTRKETEDIIRSAMETVLCVNKEFGYKLIFISRSDSCLRGHFPLETDIMRKVLTENGIAVWNKIPFAPVFIEAGRLTIDGIHYMKDGDRLIPVSETEFANDNVFAYKTSVLYDYIKEKGGTPDEYIIVNAKSYDELTHFTDNLLEEVKYFDGAVVIRSSSSLPKAISSIKDIPLLGRDILAGREGVGCFIVGSHVKKTTSQLNQLLDCNGTSGIELPIDRILDEPEELLNEVRDTILKLSDSGLTPVIFTARKEVRIDDTDKRQQLGQIVSDFLVSIVEHLPYSPTYLVAKGGITSHDILTKGLHVKTATVMGQIVSSVPCIMTDKFPYIIFPGNVGNENSLKEVFEKLK